MTFTTTAALAAVHGATVAAAAPTTTSSTSDVEPGVLAFLIVAALGVALVFLLRSMNKQFRKIGPKPDEEILDLLAMARRTPAGGEDDDEDAWPEGAVPGEVVSDDEETGEDTAQAAPGRPGKRRGR